MLTLQSVTPIATDGVHNAFTSLVQWHGHTYVAYRQAQSHNPYPPGHIVIQRSADLETWEVVTTLRTGGDDRDPHLVATDDELHCLWGAYIPLYDSWTGRLALGGGDLCTYAARTRDGHAWGPSYRLCRPGSWLWSCIQEISVPAEPGLLTRAMGRTADVLPPAPAWYGMSYDVGDGAVDRCHTLTLWRGHTPMLWQLWGTVIDACHTWSDWQPSEPVLFWKDADTLACIARTEERTLYGQASRPFVVWIWYELRVPGKASVHAPAILRIPGLGWIVAGREYIAGKRKTDKPAVCQTMLWKLFAKQEHPAGRPQLERILALPSSGDCSYPGLAWDAERGEVLCSFYSQHARDTALVGLPHAADVFLARLTLED